MADPHLSQIRYWKDCRWQEQDYGVGNARGIRLVVYHPVTHADMASPTLLADTPVEEAASKHELVKWANAQAREVQWRR